MNIEQIMALADEYSTYSGHPVMRKDLQAAIESLVQERDLLNGTLESRDRNIEQLAAENKTLRDALAADAARYRWLCERQQSIDNAMKEAK
jgi:predicted RNase H-like nuclease (RuvC/YqgF family)